MREASEPGSTIAAHLNETVRRHADELLTRDGVKHLIDELRQASPATVDELIPGVLKLGEVQQVLQLLLREEVPIRQLGPILEALGDYARAPRTRSCWRSSSVNGWPARFARGTAIGISACTS